MFDGSGLPAEFASPAAGRPAAHGNATCGSAEPPELPLERLEHEICQLAARINASTCRWLELIAEFDRREGWGSWGCRSCAEWVAWRCALDPRAAREHVRVARRLQGLPRIHTAFSDGRLSYSKVRALTRVAEEESEQELLELAGHATAAQLDRIVRGLRRVSSDEAEEMHTARHLSFWWEADGSLSISGNLPPEEGAKLLSAIDAMHDQLRATPSDEAGEALGPAEPRSRIGPSGSAEPPEPRRTTNAEALVAMADTSVATRQAPGQRYEVVVHVDAGTLSLDTPGTCVLESGSALASETARRLSCDAAIVSLVEPRADSGREGEALSVGRRTRSIPPALGRALRARDDSCRFPGCENRRFLDAHHIRHWARGGETSLDNLTRLCRRHHRLLHEGGFSLERLADGELRFRDPDGNTIPDSPPLPEGEADALPATSRELAPGTGERVNLDYAVGALTQL